MASKEDPEETSVCCTSFFQDEDQPIVELEGASGAPVYRNLLWDKESILKVHFDAKNDKMKTWRWESKRLEPLISLSDIVELANTWSNLGKGNIPKFEEVEDKCSSHIRVLLTTGESLV